MSSQGEIRDGDGARFRLIETLGWRPDAGFVRLDRHFSRLAASAAALGFVWSGPAGREELRQAVTAAGQNGAAGPLRVRLELARDGGVAASATPFTPLAPDETWRLRIATTRLCSRNPLLAHKTTERAAFDAARAEFAPAEADEVILLNERGELCEGAITSIFVDAGDGGRLLTPAARCGLLPGVLRAELLEEGRAEEAVLGVADLARAQAVWVGNSLRGLIAARLI
jgi:4-amino-4-deoxychorismate lyase